MKKTFQVVSICLVMAAPDAIAQSIDIINVVEKAGNVEITILTDIVPPFEVMAGIGLAGQADEDVWIGNNERQTVLTSTDTLVVRAAQKGEELPTGTYDAEVNFYPRWGADNSPTATKAVKENISAVKSVELNGSGEAASDIAERENLQRWVMLNTAIGDKFSLSKFEAKLGKSERLIVSNRNDLIVAHYFPKADMTLFENTLKAQLVTWREGRVSSL